MSKPKNQRRPLAATLGRRLGQPSWLPVVRASLPAEVPGGTNAAQTGRRDACPTLGPWSWSRWRARNGVRHFQEPLIGARTAMSARIKWKELADKAVRAPVLCRSIESMREPGIVAGPQKFHNFCKTRRSTPFNCYEHECLWPYKQFTESRNALRSGARLLPS